MVTTDQACTVALKTNDNGAINTILIDDTTVNFLKRLGWTPPAEPTAPVVEPQPEPAVEITL